MCGDKIKYFHLKLLRINKIAIFSSIFQLNAHVQLNIHIVYVESQSYNCYIEMRGIESFSKTKCK
jgi:hypothetical protein